MNALMGSPPITPITAPSVSLAKEALHYVVTSKTLVLWLIFALMAFMIILISLAVLIIFNVQNPYVNEILNFFGIAGGGGTVRNVVSDGIMPRVPQTAGAWKQPDTLNIAPKPMINTASTDSNSMMPPINPQGGLYIPIPGG